jgi:hypothetical protein
LELLPELDGGRKDIRVESRAEGLPAEARAAAFLENLKKHEIVAIQETNSDVATQHL